MQRGSSITDSELGLLPAPETVFRGTWGGFASGNGGKNKQGPFPAGRTRSSSPNFLRPSSSHARLQSVGNKNHSLPALGQPLVEQGEDHEDGLLVMGARMSRGSTPSNTGTISVGKKAVQQNRSWSSSRKTTIETASLPDITAEDEVLPTKHRTSGGPRSHESDGPSISGGSSEAASSHEAPPPSRATSKVKDPIHYSPKSFF